MSWRQDYYHTDYNAYPPPPLPAVSPGPYHRGPTPVVASPYVSTSYGEPYEQHHFYTYSTPLPRSRSNSQGHAQPLTPSGVHVYNNNTNIHDHTPDPHRTGAYTQQQQPATATATASAVAGATTVTAPAVATVYAQPAPAVYAQPVTTPYLQTVPAPVQYAPQAIVGPQYGQMYPPYDQGRVPVHDAELTKEVRSMHKDVQATSHSTALAYREHPPHAQAYLAQAAEKDSQMNALNYHYWKSVDQNEAIQREKQKEDDRKRLLLEHDSAKHTQKLERDAIFNKYQIDKMNEDAAMQAAIHKRDLEQAAEKAKKDAEFSKFEQKKAEAAQAESEKIKKAQAEFENKMRKEAEEKQAAEKALRAQLEQKAAADAKAAADNENAMKTRIQRQEEEKARAQAEQVNTVKLKLEKEAAEKADKEKAYLAQLAKKKADEDAEKTRLEQEAMARADARKKAAQEAEQRVMEKMKRDQEEAAKREQDLIRQAEERKKMQAAHEKEIYEKYAKMLADSKKAEEEKEKEIVLKFQQREAEIKKKAIEQEKLVVAQLKDREAAEKKKKDEEAAKFANEMATRLAKFGFQDNQIAAFIDPSKAEPARPCSAAPCPAPAPQIQQTIQYHTTSAPRAVSVGAMAPMAPTTTTMTFSGPPMQRICLHDISVDTLAYYQVQWEPDYGNPDYVIVPADITQTDIDYMYEHTRRTRHQTVIETTRHGGGGYSPPRVVSVPVDVDIPRKGRGRRKDETYVFVRRKPSTRRGTRLGGLF